MKKIVNGNILRGKMEEAINLLCNTVKSTLGPKGSNAIIDHSTFTPFITNDGVTIALNIASDDEVINTILELAKEASIKTNETVGDGTTTTLVYLQSIFNNGLKYFKNGYNPLVLKEELFVALKEILKEIDLSSKIPSKEELKHIASISANDNEIGNIISDVYLKILNKNAINIREGSSYDTKVYYLKGYVIDTLLASPYFLNNEKEINLNKVKILIINNHLDSLESLSNLLNDEALMKENIIIIANSYNPYLVDEIVNLNTNSNSSIFLINSPEYGLRRIDILNDLSAISKAKIVKNLDYIDKEFLGEVDNVTINSEKIIFNFKFNDQIKKRIVDLNLNLNKENADTIFLSKRLTMFEKGSATIEVGGLTKIERREKKMRYDDALWAISEASFGVSVGEGITGSIISKKINDQNIANQIFKEALKEPLKIILKNAGLNEDEIIKNIEKHNYKILYNVKTNKYEDIENTIVLDPTSVIKESLSNATSIAAMLLTTDNLIINEYQNNMNKINEYVDL